MAPVPSLNPDRSLWDWIASELRFQREKAGMSLSALGEKIGAQKQTVSNIEHGRPGWRLNENQAAKLDALFGLNLLFTRLLNYAKAGHDAEWFRQWLYYAERALSIRMYEALLIPGLLQTPEYAHALLERGDLVRDVDGAVKARISRQELLTRSNAPKLWVLLNEGVLDQPVGGPEVMREQLARLLEQPRHVVVRVVPRSAGSHLGLEGSFLITTTEAEEVAYMEACGGGRLAKDRAEVERYCDRMESISSVALPTDRSRDLIAAKMEGYGDVAQDLLQRHER